MKFINSGKKLNVINNKEPSKISIPSDFVQLNGKEKKNDRNILMRYWRVYCENTSVHGMKYLSGDGLHWTER